MPHVATDPAVSTLAADHVTEPALRAWRSLRRHLEARHREINAEVAHYPTPIARCDVQLSKLLEQRARLYREIERAAAIGAPPAARATRSEWLRSVAHFVASAEPDCDDDVEVALRSALGRAMAML